LDFLLSNFVQLGTVSSWSECALALPIDTDLGWCVWLSGFSISLWLRIEKSAAPESSIPHMEHRSHLHRNYSGQLSDSVSDSWSEWGVVSSASWLKDGKYLPFPFILPLLFSFFTVLSM
jgi:hypothetical protein